MRGKFLSEDGVFHVEAVAVARSSLLVCKRPEGFEGEHVLVDFVCILVKCMPSVPQLRLSLSRCGQSEHRSELCSCIVETGISYVYFGYVILNRLLTII